ncbi:contractile injection system protein, VgrG/Pvc8 family [Maridesulfovibrio sp.]|uniref:contractile injection system protein, VgrG/Pvc8 family n=1 Tax=Maridesulfovibrio sp. TaxID=2795000 RepID=UPI003BA9B454
MGLTHKPVYRVECNGKDITAAIQNDLISLTITDEAGVKSDSLDISINDKGYAVPPAGSQFKVWLGYGKAATFMGLYVLNSVRLPGPPDKMIIKAAGAPQEKSKEFSQLQTQKVRSWRPQTIGQLVTTVAADHGLIPAISQDLFKIVLPHIDQIDESDIHLLTRISMNYDAIAKANAGKLIFARKGQGKTVSGMKMPVFNLVPDQVTNFNLDISWNADFKTVIAHWRDVEAAKDIEEVAGVGEPIHRIRNIYPNSEAALKAARGKLDSFYRSKHILSGSLPGRPELRAECRLLLSGFRAEKNGLWSITRATHKLGSGGYVTSVEGERV